jgi:hypothetical protein
VRKKRSGMKKKSRGFPTEYSKAYIVDLFLHRNRATKSMEKFLASRAKE